MKNKKLRQWTYFGAIFVATYASLPAYINSSFLKKFLSEEGIGWLYATGSLLTIILMLGTPDLIRRFGHRRMLRWFIGLSFFATLPLIAYGLPRLAYQPELVLIAFGLYLIFGYLTRYTLDVYLENISDNKSTGWIRGVYMTFYNFAWLISPFVATQLIDGGRYALIYGLAGFLLLPFWLIAWRELKELKGSTRQLERSVWKTLKKLWRGRKEKTRDIYNILLVDFILNFFYAVMVVYMPLYLRDHIGLSWAEIGLAFTIMLLPFVLFELPLGKIADKWWGEKEILVGGLVIATGATIACSFLDTPNWIAWAILLFLTRTGAASIEIMKETYLFKKISGADAGVISLSRVNVPLSYLVGPLFVSLVLFAFDFRYVFLGLGLIVLLALIPALRLRDTK